MTLPRLLATAALAASAVVPMMVAAPASALSCVEVSKVIADAQQVYAGRIIDARDGHVLVDVKEVWKGGPVEEEIWLGVEGAYWTPWTRDGHEAPDGYSSPRTWVFAPLHPSVVGPCEAWSLDRGMRKHLLPHRPEQPQVPVATDAPPQEASEAAPAPKPTESSVWPLVGGGISGAVVVMTVVALVLRRRRSMA